MKFRNFNAKVDYSPTDRVQAFFRAGYFSEDRGNGKILEVNDTRWTSASGGVRIRLPDESDLQASVHGDFEDFHSNFLAVTAPSATVAPRSIVRLTIDQVVPTKAVGGVVQWAKALGTKQYFSAGTDWHWVDGDSEEDGYNAAPGPVVPPVQNAVLALKRISGGTQRSVGAFVQDILTPLPKLTLTLSGRVDQLAELRRAQPREQRAVGHADREQPAAAGQRRHRLQPARRGDVPRDRARERLGRHQLRVPRADAQRAVSPVPRRHRADARQRSSSAPSGSSAAKPASTSRRGAISPGARPGYDNRVKNPVGQRHASTVTPAQTTQQRQNLGRTRIWGIQTDVEYRIGPSFRVAAAAISTTRRR